MLKKIALPVVALVAMLILASAPAQAGVRFGITIGPPAYTYPAYPNVYANQYVDPYLYTAPLYAAPAPAYVYPSYNYRGWSRDRGHEFHENRAPAFRGHEQHGNTSRGGHRR
jgi:hypothetical protein